MLIESNFWLGMYMRHILKVMWHTDVVAPMLINRVPIFFEPVHISTQNFELRAEKSTGLEKIENPIRYHRSVNGDMTNRLKARLITDGVPPEEPQIRERLK